ncbi:hypothetical protein HWV62_10343 [Athelia sp. TMB]|nr:hypothetical protein HWV62_10343 [Athelia sp. TMB]
MGPPVSHATYEGVSATAPGSQSALSRQFSQPPGALSLLPPPQITGYTPAHTSYHDARNQWAKTAYAKSGVEVITIIFQLLREVPGKPKGQLVKNLIEGVDSISAAITPPELFSKAVQIFMPKLLLAYPGFDWNWQDMALREEKDWVDILAKPHDIPIFYHRCLKPSGNKAAKTIFKAPSNLKVALVIGVSQWEQCEAFIEEQELRNSQMTHAQSPRTQSPDTIDLLLMTQSQRTEALNASQRHHKSKPVIRPSIGTSDSSGPMLVPTTTSMPLQSHVSKRTTPTTPPSKRTAAMAFSSPDQELVKRALLDAGSSTSGISATVMLTETIDFFPIQEASFTDILSQAAPHTVVMDADADKVEHGNLHFDHMKVIGQGTFKTVHPGYLNLYDRPATGLGSEKSQYSKRPS